MNIIVLIFPISCKFSHFFSWGFIYITWNTIVQIFYNYQGQDSVKISDKISDRKPNLNMDENTQFKLIIFKCILEENVDLLIQTFKTLSLSTFSTLIFPLSFHDSFFLLHKSLWVYNIVCSLLFVQEMGQ